MERSEAEAIYAAGREPVVDALLALSARLGAHYAKLVGLAERVEELEQRLQRDSSNSSLPPSHDPPWLGKRGRSRGMGRKQGAQPGHPGHGRSLFPLERVTELVARCALSCRRAFRAAASVRSEAAIASLTVRNRLSRRQLVALMDELFGCPIAIDTIDAILSRTARRSNPCTRSCSSKRAQRARSTLTRPVGT